MISNNLKEIIFLKQIKINLPLFDYQSKLFMTLNLIELNNSLREFLSKLLVKKKFKFVQIKIIMF